MIILSHNTELIYRLQDLKSFYSVFQYIPFYNKNKTISTRVKSDYLWGYTDKKNAFTECVSITDSSIRDDTPREDTIPFF